MEKLSKEKMVELYKTMVRIREFEKEAIELAKMNLTRAAIHTYNGQEAIAVGLCAHLTHNDYIISTHRGHGHCIAKGADMKRMFAELMARKSGYCKGKGGSMHIADIDIGMLGANGIVGGGLPISVGAGLALKYLNTKNITVCFFGDAASNQGSFHESVNMAAVLKLPIIFVCENNQYGISMHVSRSTGAKNIVDRAGGYGIPGYQIDGNDVITVYNEMNKIIKQVREQGGPVLVEMMTYRMAGHYFGDNENYRSKEEVAEWAERCPIKRQGAVLCSEYNMTEEDLDLFLNVEKTNVYEASEAAKLEPMPIPEDLEEDVYSLDYKTIKWKSFVQKAQ